MFSPLGSDFESSIKRLYFFSGRGGQARRKIQFEWLYLRAVFFCCDTFLLSGIYGV